MNQLYGSVRYRKRQALRRLKWYGIVGILFLFLIVISYIVLETGIFSVRSFIFVGVEGDRAAQLLERLKPQVAASGFGWAFGPDNFFGWNKSVQYSDTRFSGITIQKDLISRQITIEAIPRERYAVWCVTRLIEESTNCFWVDPGGLAFESSPLPEGQLILVFFEYSDSTYAAPGEYVIEKPAYVAMKSILEAVRRLTISVKRAVLDRAKAEIQIETVSNTRLLFSLRFDPILTAIPALEKLAESPGIRQFEYIDFTSQNRALVKTR